MILISKSVPEKRAELIAAIHREVVKRAAILTTLYKELKKYSDANPGLLCFHYHGDITLARKEVSDTLPKFILRKLENYTMIRQIGESLLREDPTSDYRGVSAKNVELRMQNTYTDFFISANKAIEQIKSERDEREVVVDFLKSAVNLVIYLLSFTTHPGFFRTSTQSLQEIKDTARNVMALRKELVSLEGSTNASLASSMV
jgi:hypothetical protein